MINPEFLKECDDDQINKGVAWLECKKSDINHRLLHSWTMLNEQPSWCGRYFKPSSYPNDIMPIAFANGIAIMPDSDGSWKSGSLPSDPERTFGWANFGRGYKNPLRAICECYILMSVSK